nr:PTS glucose transporter subunit IIA [Bacillus sp. MUM 13]
MIRIFGYGEDTAKQTDSEPAEQVGVVSQPDEYEEVVYSSLSGTVIPLSEVPDPVFSSGAMGEGIAIEPADNKLHGPFDGTAVMVAPTKHAIGLRSNNGVEVLVHIGLDTVKLEGKPFDLTVKEGDKFHQDEVLIEFNKEWIEKQGLKTVTPVIITNTQSFQEIISENTKKLLSNQKLITVVK